MAARIHELRAERQALVKKANAALRAANEKAKTEKRRLSAEELAEADAFDVQLAAIDEEVHIEERMHDRERGSVAVVEDAPPAGGPGAMTADRMQREMGLTSRQAERATTVFERDSGRLGQPGNGRQGGIRSMGEFLQVVRHAARGAAFVDPRLMGVRDNVPDDLGQLQQMPGGRGYFAGPAGADESVDSEGGFLVQTDWGGTLTALMWDTGLLTPRVRRQPIGPGKNGIKFQLLDETSRVTGSRYGGIQVFWAAEADAFTGKKPTFRRLELRLEKLIGLMYMTDELLEDAVALQGFVNEWFPDEFAFMLDDAIYQGTGVGIPLGIMKAPALVTIAKEAGQATGTINATNLEKMFAAMPAKSLANAVWFINVACWPQLFQLSHPIGTAGVPVFLPPGGISTGPFGTIFGRQIVPIEQAAALSTTGDIVLADLNWYMMIDKGPIATAASIHVKFLTDEMAFRWVLRVDGQPIQHAPITPYKGTQTLSPFVALATR